MGSVRFPSHGNEHDLSEMGKNRNVTVLKISRVIVVFKVSYFVAVLSQSILLGVSPDGSYTSNCEN